MTINFKELARPFRWEELEWRLQRSGKNNRGVWAIAIPYLDARAIQERLDEVVGPENWFDEYEPVKDGYLCKLFIRVGPDNWVHKTDGAQETEIESLKGGISGALKRAASKWGMGRYLYELSEVYVEIVKDGGHYGKTKDGESFHWKIPAKVKAEYEAKYGGKRAEAVHGEPARPELKSDPTPAFQELFGSTISKEQAKELAQMAKELGWSAEERQQLLTDYGISAITELPRDQVPFFEAHLRRDRFAK